MEQFLLGVATSIVTYIFSYSYLNLEYKRVFNAIFANGFSDIAITIGILVLIGTKGLGLAMLGLGMGVGLSLALRAGKALYGSAKIW